MRYCIVGNSGGMKIFLGIKLQIFYWLTSWWACVIERVHTSGWFDLADDDGNQQKFPSRIISYNNIQHTCTLYVYMYFKCIFYFYRRQRVTRFSGSKWLRSQMRLHSLVSTCSKQLQYLLDLLQISHHQKYYCISKQL